MITALTFAAKRGVDVRILLPHIPDKKYAFALAKTHYKQLHKAGVHLYEYTPGFVHAKVFASDDVRGVVGTINLDYRSLYLHFECAAYMEGVSAVLDILKDFEQCFAQSQEVTEEDIRHTAIWYKMFGPLLKLIAPLM
jgi:cardiolipin synthase